MNTENDHKEKDETLSCDETAHIDTESVRTSSGFGRLFRNRSGRLRTVWRLLLYILFAGALALLFGTTTRLFFGMSSGETVIDSPRSIIGIYVADAALILAAYIMVRRIDRRPFLMYGLGFHPGWIREFIGGMGAGSILLFLVFCFMSISGSGTVVWIGTDPAVLGGVGTMFIVFLGAAALEELLMRGYPFQVFVEGTTPLIGVVAFSSLFGLGHTNNEHWGLIGFLNTSLAGVLLSVLYLKTRSLWLPIGLHTAWNWMQGSVFGIPVSGIAIENSLISFTPRGASPLNGGEFGAEGSLFATAVLTGAIVYTLRNRRSRPSGRLSRLWDETVQINRQTAHLPSSSRGPGDMID